MTTRLDVLSEFKDDHRKIRDTLFALKGAFQSEDPPRARTALVDLDALTGPHFRFEEETLYPALKPVLGDYIDKMLSDHDGAIATARQLATLVQQETFATDLVQSGVRGVLSMLPHVSDCDGLAIFMETFAPAEIERIGDNIQACREAGVPLLQWAAMIRHR